MTGKEQQVERSQGASASLAPVSAHSRSLGSDNRLYQAANELTTTILDSMIKHEPGLAAKIQIMKIFGENEAEVASRITFEDLVRIADLLGCDLKLTFQKKAQA